MTKEIEELADSIGNQATGTARLWYERLNDIAKPMKVCPYCGKEYSEDAVSCSIDGELLVGDSLQPTVPKLEQKPVEQANGLVFPEYQWSARDAWKCLGAIVLLQFIFEAMSLALEKHSTSFGRWRESGPGYFFWSLLFFFIWLGTAAVFARTETLNSFRKGFGLDRKPSEYAWWGVIYALVLRAFGHFVLSHGWSNGVSNSDLRDFRNTFGPERYLYLVPLVLLAPVFEEAVNRGFLYKAFRGSYSLPASMFLIVAWTCFTHWNQYFHSWIATFDLSLLAVVQCYLREKSGSLWDCVICHAAFNGSGLII